MNKAQLFTVAVITGAALFGAGCGTTTTPPGRHAMAELSPASGSNVRGVVHFYETAKGVKVSARITGLTPGLHGFHIHEKGDCSLPDATSAGAHFNPGGMKHGAPGDALRHAGDFGNVTADASGTVKFDTVDTHLTFDGPNSISGRGVIVHADPDDLTSQPAGKAGARVACGAIKMM